MNLGGRPELQNQKKYEFSEDLRFNSVLTSATSTWTITGKGKWL